VALVVLVALIPFLRAQAPFPTPAQKTYASGLCQMEYADRVVMGKTAWEVTTITMGPEGGKLGEMQFKPGDLIIMWVRGTSSRARTSTSCFAWH